MVIFLHGPDSYRRIQKKREIVEKFLKTHSVTGLGEFDFVQEGGLERFIDFAGSRSLFDTSRLAIVSEPFVGGERAVEALKSALEGKDLTVVTETSEKKILKAFSFLKDEPVLHQEFEHLEGTAWSNFIAREAKERGVALHAEAAQFLGQVYKNDSWSLVTELEKLRWLVKKEISRKDLEGFYLEAAPEFWPLLQSLKSGMVAKRLNALETALLQNEAPAKLFNILAASWKQKIPQLAQLDLKVKSGKLEYEEALLDLMI